MARADVPKLAWLGIAGIALVHAATSRDRPHRHRRRARDPVPRAALLLIWLRVVHKRRAALRCGRRSCSRWSARRSSSTRWDGVPRRARILAALAGAVTLVIYLVSSEDAGRRYDAFTILLWGFGFATLFWLVVAPVWTFPWELLGSARNLGLAFGVAVIAGLGG